MDQLTPRQAHILKTLVEEYIGAAEPVGSESLERKYNLGLSPATIRNEMVKLTQTGYLRQPHASSGRLPTSKALRFYVQQLMEEHQMPVTEEAKAKQMIEESNKEDVDETMRRATHSLAQATHSLCVGTLEDEDMVWHSGYAYILDKPEFYNIDVTAHVLSLIEEAKRLHELFFERLAPTPVAILFGEELGWQYFEPVGIVAARFSAGDKSGSLGIIGPVSLQYADIVPTVRYYGRLLSELFGKL